MHLLKHLMFNGMVILPNTHTHTHASNGADYAILIFHALLSLHWVAIVCVCVSIGMPHQECLTDWLAEWTWESTLELTKQASSATISTFER